MREKENIPEILAKELRELEVGTVGVSTVTDPYQPAESRSMLTRKCLELLSKNQFPVSIQTKSDLVLRDLDIINSTGFEVGVTLTTLRNDLARRIEPNASKPDSRVQILDEFHSRGVRTWIFLGPIIPQINDDFENIAEIFDVAKRTKSKILYDKLNLKRWVLERMILTLKQFDPELVERIPKLVEASSDWWRTLSAKIRARSAEIPILVEPAFQ